MKSKAIKKRAAKTAVRPRKKSVAPAKIGMGPSKSVFIQRNDNGGAILFFDEADVLFGKRSSVQKPRITKTVGKAKKK